MSDFFWLCPVPKLCLYGHSQVGPGWDVGWGEAVGLGGGVAVISISRLQMRESPSAPVSLSHLASVLLIRVYWSPPAAIRLLVHGLMYFRVKFLLILCNMYICI